MPTRPITGPLTRSPSGGVTGVGGGGAWLPRALSSLLFWHDPGDLSTLYQDAGLAVPVTAAGQPVRVIRDKSGNGLDWVAPDDVARPILRQDAAGYYYLEMDGSARTASVTLPAISAAVSMFASIEWESQPSGQLVIGVASTSWGRGAMYIRSQASPRYAFGAFVEGTGAAAGGNHPGAERLVLGGVSIKSGAQTVYRNGLAVGSGSAGAITTTAQAWELAGRAGGSFDRLKGRFYGDAAYSRALNSAEIIQVSAFLARRYGDTQVFVAIGDSHTAATYPARLESDLRTSAAARYSSVNLGVSGETTANMVARRAANLAYGPVRFAVLYGGANDGNGVTTVQAAPAATAITFNVAAGKGVSYGVGSTVNVGLESGVIQSIAGDAITLTAPLTAPPASGTAVTINTTENLKAIIASLQGGGVSRVLVLDQHFLNFASGGDTISAQRSDLATLRSNQQAAASATGAEFLSLYSAFRAKIVDGTYAEGNDVAYHTAVSNIHLNETGNELLADTVEAKLIALGWV